MKELEAENTRLQRLLEFKAQFSRTSIPAKVIGRDSSLLSRTLLIDQGKKSGVEVGMAAISRQGVVGRITETNTTVSRVMLLEDPDLRLGVIIQRTREHGLLVGGRNGSANVIYLDPNSDVKKDDVIVSYPSSITFPKGLFIGYVEDIRVHGAALYKMATIRFAADCANVEEVLCIK
jgi:rod shape-determining protein MreC